MYTRVLKQCSLISLSLILYTYLHITPSSIVYPVGKVFDFVSQKENWILFCQEKATSAMLLWDESSHRVSRMTSARFNPACIKISPAGDTVAFIDTGVLWIRKLWKRHTRALSPERPIGTIVDYCWIDDQHIVVCAANNHTKSLYCITTDEEIATPLFLNDAPLDENLLFPDSHNNMLIYLSRSASEDSIHVIFITQRGEELVFGKPYELFSSSTIMLAFCQFHEGNFITFLGAPREALEQNDSSISCTIFVCKGFDGAGSIVETIGRVNIDKNIAFSGPEKSIILFEGMLPLLPYYNETNQSICLPQIGRDGCNSWKSELHEFKLDSNTKAICATEDSISFLNFRKNNSGYLYGGYITHDNSIQMPCRVQYTSDNETLLFLGQITV